jgi:hypothetical protein
MLVGRPEDVQRGIVEILVAERWKMIKMLNDLADLKFVARGDQLARLGKIEQALRLALVETEIELRRG